MRKCLLCLLLIVLVPRTQVCAQSPVIRAIIDSVSIDSLITTVKELTGEVPVMINGRSETILSRHRDQPGNALAEAYIKQKLESYGLPVTIQNYSATGNNVLASQIGTQFPNKKFIICAHYDAMPTGPIAPGADDNGDAVAAVLEAARIFSRRSFPFTIVYALWDEEEVPPCLLGSTYFANQAALSGDSILGVINLEMLGWDSDNDGKCSVQELNPVHGVQIRHHLWEINTQYGIDLYVVASPPMAESDHAPFWYNGFDAILFDQFTYQDRNLYYHTTQDRVQFINRPYYLRMAKLVLGTLALLALDQNFDIVHVPVPPVIPPQATNTTLRIYTAFQIGSGSRAPRLYYRIRASDGNAGAFAVCVGTAAGGGQYTFSIPALPNGTSVEYYVAAQDENATVATTSPLGGGGYDPPGSNPPATLHRFLVANLAVVWSDPANSMVNWAATGGWNVTSEDFVSPPASFTDSPGGGAPPSTFAVLSLADTIPAQGSRRTFLEFDSRWSVEYGYDYGQVGISTNRGASWNIIGGQHSYFGRVAPSFNFATIYSGMQSTWAHEVIDISAVPVNRNETKYFLV
jgi:hypothetical protein